jgi:hypothetical protein
MTTARHAQVSNTPANAARPDPTALDQQINNDPGKESTPEMATDQLAITALPRLLAVEVLLAEPEALHDDCLESCLYMLRDRLRTAIKP